MAQQYIFQMQGLTKAYPGGKKVFENIWLSFYPDAKIGVVGVTARASRRCSRSWPASTRISPARRSLPMA